MDTLSTSITPNFQIPKSFNPTHHHNFRPTPLPHHSTTLLTTTPSFSTTFPQKDNFTPLYPRNPQTTPSFPTLNFHRKASSGYAAALLDISHSNGVVLGVAKDVKRLLRLLRKGQVRDFMLDEGIEERVKGEALKELVEKGKFNGYLVGLVKLVIDKGKRVELVKDIMLEFESILYQLAPSY